ncbi:MAG: LLM class flavin-dependent oxidoreductase, partial [Trebonia sp.]
RALIDEGRAAAGRTDPHRLVVYVAVDRFDGAEVGGKVRVLAEAGVDTVVLHRAQHAETDPVDLIRFMAEEVRPLV